MNGKILKFADSKRYLGKIARSGENNTLSLAFGRYFGCEVFSQSGYWQSYRYDASNSDNAYASIIPNGDSKFLTFKKVAGEHISRFLIHSGADGFDTGTTISIYGVRA